MGVILIAAIVGYIVTAFLYKKENQIVNFEWPVDAWKKLTGK